MKQKRNTLIGQRMRLTGRLCGLRPGDAPLERPSKVYLPARPLATTRRVWLLAGFTIPEFAFHGSL